METRDGVADVMEYYNGGNNYCNDFLQDWQFCPAGNNIDNTTGNNVNYSNSNSTGNGNSNGYSNIANNQAQQVAAQAEKPAVRIKVNGKKNSKQSKIKYNPQNKRTVAAVSSEDKRRALNAMEELRARGATTDDLMCRSLRITFTH